MNAQAPKLVASASCQGGRIEVTASAVDVDGDLLLDAGVRIDGESAILRKVVLTTGVTPRGHRRAIWTGVHDGGAIAISATDTTPDGLGGSIRVTGQDFEGDELQQFKTAGLVRVAKFAE